MEDHELIRQFVDQRSEQAFAELVRRHIHLVYSSALRQVRNPASAEDITQSVFVLLAQRAPKIHRIRSLSGWLLSATRGVALNSIRAESRRRRHELEAAAMKSETQNLPNSNWDEIKPHLDEAVAALKPDDHDALTLRYFQNCEIPQVAAVLGISAAAAQKRISRAMIRLRKFFARRGITTSSTALASELVGKAITPAPAALSSKIALAALAPANGVAISSAASRLTRFIAITQLKIAGILLAAAMAIGVGIPLVHEVSSPTTSGAAQAATMPDDIPLTGDWQSEFRRVYALNTDEIIRLVPPPFIPERIDFVNSIALGDLGKPQLLSCAITWDGTDLRFFSSVDLIPRDIANVLRQIGGIWPQDTDLPREKLSHRVDGDWVIRLGATTEQKIAALAPLLLGPGKKLTLKPMERDVIVATGVYEYKPAESVQRLSTTVPQILLYSSPTHTETSSVSQTKEEMLNFLGEVLNHPMIIEAQLGEKQSAVLCTDRNLSLITPYKGNILTDEKIDDVLALVSEQTSLEFKREKRTVPTWCLVDEPK